MKCLIIRFFKVNFMNEHSEKYRETHKQNKVKSFKFDAFVRTAPTLSPDGKIYTLGCILFYSKRLVPTSI